MTDRPTNEYRQCDSGRGPWVFYRATSALYLFPNSHVFGDPLIAMQLLASVANSTQPTIRLAIHQSATDPLGQPVRQPVLTCFNRLLYDPAPAAPTGYCLLSLAQPPTVGNVSNGHCPSLPLLQELAAVQRIVGARGGLPMLPRRPIN